MLSTNTFYLVQNLQWNKRSYKGFNKDGITIFHGFGEIPSGLKPSQYKKCGYHSI
jgi:hypothetical protein